MSMKNVSAVIIFLTAFSVLTGCATTITRGVDFSPLKGVERQQSPFTVETGDITISGSWNDKKLVLPRHQDQGTSRGSERR